MRAYASAYAYTSVYKTVEQTQKESAGLFKFPRVCKVGTQLGKKYSKEERKDGSS